MVISGRADGDIRRLTIGVSVSNGEEPYREIVVEVDTASDLELALPSQVIGDFHLERAGDANFRSNGTSHERPRWGAYIEWHDGPILANVVETERPPYVGMGLLWDSYLSAYLLPSGAVTVTRMVNWEDIRREMEGDF